MQTPAVREPAPAETVAAGPEEYADREALKAAVRAGVLVPIVHLAKATGVDAKSLAALLEREKVPMYRNPSRRGRVASLADVVELVRGLTEAGGTRCGDCRRRTGSVSATYCGACSEARRVRGLQDWHRDLQQDPERRAAHYAERSRNARPIPESALNAHAGRILDAKTGRDREIESRGLWTRDDGAEFLGISKRAFVEHEEGGHFAPVDVLDNGFGFPRPVYDPRHIKEYARRRLRVSLNPIRVYDSTLALTGSRSIAERTAARVDERLERFRRIRTGVGRADEIRELLLAGADQAIYTYKGPAIRYLSFTQLCAEAARAVWLDQVDRDVYDWIPREWASKRDPREIASEYGENVTARVRRLVGAELKGKLESAKALQIARTTS